ncbi:hypothetical protein J6590_057167, partial [Homalodisca vitripennis]
GLVVVMRGRGYEKEKELNKSETTRDTLITHCRHRAAISSPGPLYLIANHIIKPLLITDVATIAKYISCGYLSNTTRDTLITHCRHRAAISSPGPLYLIANHIIKPLLITDVATIANYISCGYLSNTTRDTLITHCRHRAAISSPGPLYLIANRIIKPLLITDVATIANYISCGYLSNTTRDTLITHCRHRAAISSPGPLYFIANGIIKPLLITDVATIANYISCGYLSNTTNGIVQ